MRIDSVNISGFGKLSDFKASFSESLNVIYGLNESGKSTVQEFIKAMLYGLPGGKPSKDGYPPPLKLKSPWNGGRFGGSMDYTGNDGLKYRIIRDFARNTVKIYNSSFEDISTKFRYGADKLPAFAEAHTGMNEKCFDSTVFIRQMSLDPGRDRLQEVQDRLLNLSLSGDENISYISAKRALNDALISGVGTGRTSVRPLDKAVRRLEELESRRDMLFAGSNEAAMLFEKLSASRDRIAALASEESILRKRLSEARLAMTEHGLDKAASDGMKESGKFNSFIKYLKIFVSSLLMISVAASSAFLGLVISKRLPGRMLAYLKPALWPVAAVVLLSVSAYIFLSYLDTSRKMYSSHNVLLAREKESLRLAGIAGDLSLALQETSLRLSGEMLLAREYEIKLEKYDNAEDKLQITEEEIAGLKERIHSLEETGTALKTAIDTLEQCSSRIKAGIMPRLNDEMSSIILKLTGGKYSDLRAGDSMVPSLADTGSDNIATPAYLSSGTADQVYLAMRLATAFIFGNNKLSLPVFLDEAFTQFDDKRLRFALEYFVKLSEQTQVLVFTCRRRETELLADIAGSRVNLIEL